MFGISHFDIVCANEKIKAQREYMLNVSFVNQLGKVRSLLDCSMSANLSKKYYAEVSNRMNTLSSFSLLYDQRPVFLTITLNGCFRDALKGDYSRFKSVDFKYIPQIIKMRMKNGEALEIRDLVQILNHQWNLLIMRFCKRFKDVERSYVRCFEPHKKDGVPHIHALFYMPAHTISYLFDAYKDLFYAPQNLRTDAITPQQARNGEINGFQWSIDNPTGYVMKYIQKTFVNLYETQELDELATWYIKHKVRRFITSRTKVPLWVYRRINFIASMRDFYHLCNFKNNGENIIEWDFKDKFIHIFLPDRDERIILENDTLTHTINDKVVNVYVKEKPPKIQKSEYNLTSKCPESIDLTISRVLREIEVFRREVAKARGDIKKPPLWMSNYELYTYYSQLDKAKCNIQHLAYVENIMLDRGLNSFTRKNEKHDLNAPDLEDFIERGLREYEF